MICIRMRLSVMRQGTVPMAKAEASFRKLNLQLDHAQAPGSFTKPRFTGLLCVYFSFSARFFGLQMFMS